VNEPSLPRPPTGYEWVPGTARHDRGYTPDEARLAVGPGWAELVEEACRTVNDVVASSSRSKKSSGALTGRDDGRSGASGLVPALPLPVRGHLAMVEEDGERGGQEPDQPGPGHGA
jgi:hypothetical protein